MSTRAQNIAAIISEISEPETMASAGRMLLAVGELMRVGYLMRTDSQLTPEATPTIRHVLVFVTEIAVWANRHRGTEHAGIRAELAETLHRLADYCLARTTPKSPMTIFPARQQPGKA